MLIIILTYVVYRVFRWLARYLTGQVKALDGEEDSMMDRRADTISRVASTSGVAVIIGTAVQYLQQALAYVVVFDLLDPCFDLFEAIIIRDSGGKNIKYGAGKVLRAHPGRISQFVFEWR